MSFTGAPHDGPLSTQEFYSQALKEANADKRRRLFADARQSNPASYQLWVKAAEVEEHWGADKDKLKTLLARGVTVFKNPAGATCTENHDHSQHGLTGGPHAIDKNTWLSEAEAAQESGKGSTADALREVLGENL
ncbi:hypothetical protein EDD11_005350 [Mortierella claussenii]|nr:hypothetical protein EDD11_005350 [Mortierella claussenii]